MSRVRFHSKRGVPPVVGGVSVGGWAGTNTHNALLTFRDSFLVHATYTPRNANAASLFDPGGSLLFLPGTATATATWREKFARK